MRRGPLGHRDPEEPRGQKIICAAYPKNGTTTLQEACRHLGYKPCEENSRALHAWFADELDLEITEDFISGFPYCLLVEELIDRYPDAKVILPYREVEGWIRSLRYWMRKGVVKGFEIFIQGVKSDDTLRKMYSAHMEYVQNTCYQRSVPLLEVSWELGHGWNELCAFLGDEVPEIPFPHQMRSDQ